MNPLSRMFKQLSDRQSGLLKSFNTFYSYVLVSTLKEEDKHYGALFKVLGKNPVWTMERVKEKFPVKIDSRGRRYLLSYSLGVMCRDVSKQDKFPSIEKNDSTYCTVRRSTCKTCDRLPCTDSMSFTEIFTT